MNATLPSLVGAALLATLPLAATTSTTPTTPTALAQDDARQPSAGGLLPAATAPIDIPVDRDLSLADLVDSLAASTGLRFVVSSATRQILNDTPCGLLAGGVVQPDEVYSFVESVLKRHRVVMERMSGQDVPVAALYWLDGGRDTSALSWSTITADRIEDVRSHAAILVQCTLDVTPSDARMLANAVRPLMRDTNYQNILSINNSTILVRGTGTEVAGFVDIFQQATKNETVYMEALRAAEAKAAEARQGAAPQNPGDGR